MSCLVSTDMSNHRAYSPSLILLPATLGFSPPPALFHGALLHSFACFYRLSYYFPSYSFSPNANECTGICSKYCEMILVSYFNYLKHFEGVAQKGADSRPDSCWPLKGSLPRPAPGQAPRGRAAAILGTVKRGSLRLNCMVLWNILFPSASLKFGYLPGKGCPRDQPPIINPGTVSTILPCTAPHTCCHASCWGYEAYAGQLCQEKPALGFLRTLPVRLCPLLILRRVL